MKEKLFRTIRVLPETNSSSSHTIVIGALEPGSVNVSEWLKEDGKLHFSGLGLYFNWGWDRYNDFYTKVAYSYGILEDDPKLLGEVIKEVTGFDSVFEYTGSMSIDHQGFNENYDNIHDKEFLKEFLFSSNSWLFIGNDNDDDPADFFKVPGIENLNYPVAIATLSLPFGDMDIEIYNLTGITEEIAEELRKNLPGEYFFIECIDGEYLISTNNATTDRICRQHRYTVDPEDIESGNVLKIKPRIWSDELGDIS